MNHVKPLIMIQERIVNVYEHYTQPPYEPLIIVTQIPWHTQRIEDPEPEKMLWVVTLATSW